MPDEPLPALVTLHVWRVPRRRTVHAVARVAAHHRGVPRARFAKVLGTSRGFTPRSADPNRWALLATWATSADADAFERSTGARGWNRIADERWRVDLLPLASRGRWSGRAPFGVLNGRRTDGPVAALTRARLAPRTLVRFWRATPAVAAALAAAGGLRVAFGVGEAPVAWQGTFSVWDSASALRAFAHGSVAHVAAVRRTPRERWYAEELFARFAVVGSNGTVDGRDPLG